MGVIHILEPHLQLSVVVSIWNLVLGACARLFIGAGACSCSFPLIVLEILLP